MKDIIHRMTARVPMAWSVGNRQGVGSKATPVQPSIVSRWRARAHGVYERVADATSQVEEPRARSSWEREAGDQTRVDSGAVPQREEEEVQDRFMAAFSASLRLEPPAPDQGIVWTTSRGWRVWEEAGASTHRGMAATAVSKASWCSGSAEPVVWHKPYDAPPRWFVRGTREYEAKVRLGAQSWAGGVGQRTPGVSTGAVDATPRVGCRQAPRIGRQARRRKRATAFQPPVGVNSVPAPGPRRQSWRRTRGRRSGTSGRYHTIETVNGTAWSSSAEYIQSSRNTDVFLVQETHVPQVRVAAEEDWLKARRMRGALIAATPSEEGGWRGGVGIVARDAYGMAPFNSEGSTEVVPGRAMLAHLGGLVKGGHGFATVYRGHQRVCRRATLRYSMLSARPSESWGVPFIIGGDWNVQPEALELTGWPERLRAKVVASSADTFVPTAAAGDEESKPARGSKLDFLWSQMRYCRWCRKSAWSKRHSLPNIGQSGWS